MSALLQALCAPPQWLFLAVHFLLCLTGHAESPEEWPGQPADLQVSRAPVQSLRMTLRAAADWRCLCVAGLCPSGLQRIQLQGLGPESAEDQQVVGVGGASVTRPDGKPPEGDNGRRVGEAEERQRPP